MKESKIVRNVLAMFAVMMFTALLAGCPNTSSGTGGGGGGGGTSPADKVVGTYIGGGLAYNFVSDGKGKGGTGSVSDSSSLSLRTVQVGDTFTWAVETSSGDKITVKIIIDDSSEEIDAEFNTANGTATIGGTPFTKQDGGNTPPYRDLSTAKVGDIIFKNGKVLSASEITDVLKNDTIAVVYKVDTANKKAYAVGKVHSNMPWCRSDAIGNYTRVDDLITNVTGTSGDYEFSTYIDGSTGLGILQNALVDSVDDYDLQTKYPAWYWCKNYGNANVPSDAKSDFKTGWYFPSVADLFDICKNSRTVNDSLSAVDGETFEVGLYLSSSQYYEGSILAAYVLGMSGGTSGHTSFLNSEALCALRQFTW